MSTEEVGDEEPKRRRSPRRSTPALASTVHDTEDRSIADLAGGRLGIFYKVLKPYLLERVQINRATGKRFKLSLIHISEPTRPY